MNTVAFAQLAPQNNARIALESVRVAASLTGLLSEVSITQTYRNLESVNIEAVYTFPLPLDATLLEMTMELNGKKLTGVVKSKSVASAQYEAAVDEGHSAVLLENSLPGVFTMNLANLMPGETAVIRFRYAQLLRWQGDSLRYHLPTTIAPHYGDPIRHGMAAHQTPEYQLTDDRRFSINVDVHGALARANFECPSHPLAIDDEGGRRRFSLSGSRTLMDRDFVLILREPQHEAGEAYVVPDQGGHLVMASFHPRFPALGEPAPRCIKLVVDCSGSMAGTSIAQAKTAIKEILGLLRPVDHFNIVAFGSSHQLLFPQAVPADENHLQTAQAFLDQLDANYGGTEIGRALLAAYNSGSPDNRAADVLLITDGEAWGAEELADAAAKSRHRIFTVGVGTAVSEAMVRHLADATGGACELVSPRENMAERIVRHFKRIDQAAFEIRLSWPGTTTRQFPGKLAAVFDGDTLHAFGWLSEPPQGEVGLVCTLANGETVEQRLKVLAADGEACNLAEVLPRVAAHSRLPELDGDEARDLAVQYQLVSSQTSCVLVYERDAAEQAPQLPEVRKVPQVVAAGWGGMGIADDPFLVLCDDDRTIINPHAERMFCRYAISPEFVDRSVMGISSTTDDFLLAGADDSWINPETTPNRHAAAVIPWSVAELSQKLRQRLLKGIAYQPFDLKSLTDLLSLGGSLSLTGELADLVKDGATEQTIVMALFLVLIDDPRWTGDRELTRTIRWASKSVHVTDELRDAVRQRVSSYLAP